jgi:hypothetical protein
MTPDHQAHIEYMNVVGPMNERYWPLVKSVAQLLGYKITRRSRTKDYFLMKPFDVFSEAKDVLHALVIILSEETKRGARLANKELANAAIEVIKDWLGQQERVTQDGVLDYRFKQ